MILFLAEYLIFLMAAALPVFLFLGSKRIFIDGVIGSTITWFIGNLIKNFFYFPRPFNPEPLAGYLSDGSFPSTHTAGAFLFATTIFLHNKTIGLVMFVLALLVGVGRVLGGVHRPIDVLGGAVLGISVALTIYHSR